MGKRFVLISAAAAVAIAALCILAWATYWAPGHAPHTSQSNSITANMAARHIVVIVEENKAIADILGNQDAPYINQLATTYAYAANYMAITHPSLPNYIALTSGTTAGIINDCNPPSATCKANVPNIADRLEEAGKSWKEYAESMPAPCYANNNGLYAVKHNPFMYYPDITSSAARCTAHVVPFSQLDADLHSSLPDVAFITPNMCNDMHDCSTQTGDAWLKQHVPSILASSAFTQEKSLLVITWDEGTFLNNRVLTIFAGSAAQAHMVAHGAYSHYAILHTIEANWRLRPLTRHDADAPLMTSMLK